MEVEEIEEIVDVCTAFWEGYQQGSLNLGVNNEYIKDTPNYYAFLIGHNNAINLNLMEYEEGWIN